MSAVAVPAKFVDLMVSARDKQETGKLYAYYRDEAMIHIGMLFFDKGRLCGCKYDTLAGLEAVKKLFHSAIATAMFVRTPKGEIEEQASMPDVNAVISNLNQDTDQLAPWSLNGVELQQAVCATLTDIMGGRGGKIVEDLAARYPPGEDARFFAEECIKMTANFLGMKKARELLSPLID